MKTKLAGLMLGLAVVASSDQARADIAAPDGCHFEVQVLWVYRSFTGGSVESWQTYDGPYYWLGDAEAVYEKLATYQEAGKLFRLLGGRVNLYPTHVRLVMICESEKSRSDEVYVIETTE
jgi:hypothetical protein